MKKILLISIPILLFLTVIVIWVYFLANGVPWEKEAANNLVYKQLGISDTDLKSKDLEWESKSGKYEVYLVYKDEPNLTYSYIHRRDLNKILLLSIHDNKTDLDIVTGKYDSLLNPDNQLY
ncbi:DUF3139 domain-containing protein [Terribacillus saccharophilus]|uniref:DUF3139 domain-containing protein n=1 Tax=Terribacillus saccharophilus TaxID=361277 RepID=UPI002989F33B|nr:DUF3139 domain-containing protein [Terribacillus saccharophilus]MCM3226454.1 DUF3139 domain-containing protein [Terribacillus saccharophilus]